MTDNKPLILMDMDGPLAAFDLHFWNRCTEEGYLFDIDNHSDQKHRWFTDHIPDPRHQAHARRMIDTTRWFRDIPVTEGAQEGMKELASKAEVFICTKPLDADEYCLLDKRQWIGKYFPKFIDRLITAPDKSVIKGDILVDDAPKPKWYARAEWAPVIFSTPSNSHPESDLYSLPHYDWSMPVDTLLELAVEAQAKRKVNA